MLNAFTVKRSEWDRGPKLGFLLSHHGMCVTGFYCEQSGIERTRLMGAMTPYSLFYEDQSKIPLLLDLVTTSKFNRLSPLCKTLMNVNDNIEICDEERENQLTQILADVGVKVTFED